MRCSRIVGQRSSQIFLAASQSTSVFGPAEPGPCAWIDDNHLVVTLADGPRIVNIETKVAYRLPENSRLLYATVLRVSREQ